METRSIEELTNQLTLFQKIDGQQKNIIQGRNLQIAKLSKQLEEAKQNSIDWKNNCSDSDEVIHAMKLELEEAKAENVKYNELLLQVSDKYKGESRHETALRRLKVAENSCCAGQAVKPPTPETP
jgi:hypothetical protein